MVTERNCLEQFQDVLLYKIEALLVLTALPHMQLIVSHRLNRARNGKCFRLQVLFTLLSISASLPLPSKQEHGRNHGIKGVHLPSQSSGLSLPGGVVQCCNSAHSVAVSLLRIQSISGAYFTALRLLSFMSLLLQRCAVCMLNYPYIPAQRTKKKIIQPSQAQERLQSKESKEPNFRLISD